MGYLSVGRVWVYGVGLFMLGLALWLQIPNAANAALACSQAGYYFVGTDPVAVQHYGVRANITVRNPSLCTGGGTSDTSAWVMIGAGFREGYAQAGYGKAPGNSQPINFAEYRRGAAHSFVRVLSNPAAGAPLYQVVYVKSSGRIQMFSDSILIRTTDFDVGLAWGPMSTWVPQYEGETHNYGDDMPGTVTQPAYFQNMALKTDVNNNIWGVPNLTVSSTSARYVAVKDSNSQIRIWTK